MRLQASGVRLSASDLSNHLGCSHLTALDHAVALGKLEAPKWQSPDLWVLRKLGEEHERAYLTHLAAAGLEIADLNGLDNENEALKQTQAAMRKGVAVIAQATLTSGRWFGRADVLRRVEKRSDLGDWSYEVYDCKLARETKGATVLQLSLYSELVAAIQGITPEWMYVVSPGNEFEAEPYRVQDFAAYYRYIRARLETFVGDGQERATYPEPNSNCDICRWRSECDLQWRKDDHLSLVAGISRLQRKQLGSLDVTRVVSLAELPVPLAQRPDRGSSEGYVRVREQARVQVAGRIQKRPIHELLELADDRGLSRLPTPSPGDVFLDLEGDRYVGRSGLEYLFGCVLEDESRDPKYECRWAPTTVKEKEAFEWFIDLVMTRWAQYPEMHVYHFAPKEPTELKRLMGNYATREEELDRMLRAGVLVDLHTILKQAVRASVEEYSLKAVEVFHGFKRAVTLEDARKALRQVQHDLELGRAIAIDEEACQAVEGYNADDCSSTRSLRNWLERERASLEKAGQEIPRPSVSAGDAPEGVSERQARVNALVNALTAGIPADAKDRSEEQSGVWLLANLLDWHRREIKAECWEYYRLRDLPEEELVYERAALAGLTLVGRRGLRGKLPIDRYRFEKQDTDIRAEDKVCEKSNKIGEVVDIDLANRTVDIKKTGETAEVHPRAVFVDSRGPKPDVLADSLYRLGSWVKDNSLDAAGRHRAGRDLLLRMRPRVIGPAGPLLRTGESVVEAAKRLACSLDHSVLPIQGPPGSGKTYTGARMICELIGQGKKVGVTAVSHKVVRNLLKEVLATAKEAQMNGVACIQKIGGRSEDKPPEGIRITTDNAKVLPAIRNGTAQIAAGTCWLWARPEYFEAVDVLFVDEAGQMSLANVLAASQAATAVVLLGDPQQLEQPQKGSHPDGAEVSALEHVLGEARTMPRERGLFLDKTRRLHPKICDFTSEVFYESLLRPIRGLDQQAIDGHPWLGNAGLWFVAVNHEGNQNASPEEVERVAGIVESLLSAGVLWTDAKGNTRQLGLDDILIVAPYNAQVSDLAARLRGVRVGTVDKFQGQEAPVVIYSLTTSSPEDAPHGMEFLYSLNRLNVATARAQGMVILVGSPKLLEAECRSPRQMKLANALCRYVELAKTVEADAARAAL